MLFNSLPFVFFLPVVVVLYYAVQQRFRWLILLTASYLFYMAWKPEYALLILGSSALDYLCGQAMSKESQQARRRPWLFLSLIGNLGVLALFKYSNFFGSSLQTLGLGVGIDLGIGSLDWILPVGISFYTFQSLSYSIEVYRGKIKAEKHFGYFALYVSFFPQLVAGPIERPQNLLPQFKSERAFDEVLAVSGLKLILWGFFKKLVIADRFALVVDQYYGNYEAASSVSLWLATLFFAVQIYCDFSAYSDIAIGSARLMGIRLMDNFKRPYLSSSLRVFWQRWHISLSTWFRDYVYIPLGGGRGFALRSAYVLMATFLISGLWHGAQWSFVFWGAWHGLFLLLERKVFKGKLRGLAGWVWCSLIVLLGWVWFRAGSGQASIDIMASLWSGPFWGGVAWSGLLLEFILLAGLVASELLGERREWNSRIASLPLWSRWGLYLLGIVLILSLGIFDERAFIYFQF